MSSWIKQRNASYTLSATDTSTWENLKTDDERLAKQMQNDHPLKTELVMLLSGEEKLGEKGLKGTIEILY